jgi:hypothetical protein
MNYLTVQRDDSGTIQCNYKLGYKFKLVPANNASWSPCILVNKPLSKCAISRAQIITQSLRREMPVQLMCRKTLFIYLKPEILL